MARVTSIYSDAQCRISVILYHDCDMFIKRIPSREPAKSARMWHELELQMEERERESCDHTGHGAHEFRCLTAWIRTKAAS